MKFYVGGSEPRGGFCWCEESTYKNNHMKNQENVCACVCVGWGGLFTEGHFAMNLEPLVLGLGEGITGSGGSRIPQTGLSTLEFCAKIYYLA